MVSHFSTSSRSSLSSQQLHCSFCGIPICRQIWKRGDTKEIAAAPFLMGILGGTCWLWYGWLKGDNTVIGRHVDSSFLYFSYSIFYWFMTRNKFWITIKFLLILCLCGTIRRLQAYHFKEKNVVIRRGATSTLPLPLCIANFLVSTEWFLYGFLKMDFYLITPNGIGSILAFFTARSVSRFTTKTRAEKPDSATRHLVSEEWS
ncbi:unnamed protein product, partial [Mesorhabditis belari]|uniref:Sugar transporter SWEET1 n=1 Tax=Mesorhabditis belari TaxID=2138241 RepID=A0AAF3FNK3_9BILA